MKNTDRERFEAMVTELLAEYDRPVNDARLELWWGALAEYDFDAIATACGSHLRDPEQGRFPPKPAHIIARIPRRADDWYDAEVAWNRVPKHESDAAYVNAEMLAALSAAQDSLDADDRVAARMAFREQYTRLVDEARTLGRKPQWFLSHSGTNRSATIAAVYEAKDAGLIPERTAQLQLSRLTNDHSAQSDTPRIGRTRSVAQIAGRSSMLNIDDTKRELKLLREALS